MSKLKIVVFKKSIFYVIMCLKFGMYERVIYEDKNKEII